VPSPGGTANYLRADGNWASPATSTAGVLLAVHQYAPASYANYSSTSLTLAAMDRTNLTVSFTAPTSGNVIADLTATANITTTVGSVLWGLLDHTSGNLYGVLLDACATTSLQTYSVTQLITGLTPGNSYQMDWALASTTTSQTAHTYAGGTASKTYSATSPSPAVMKVWAA
jgi:hypothetical protein